MRSMRTKGARFGPAFLGGTLLAVGMAIAGTPARAQQQQPVSSAPIFNSGSAADALSWNVRSLSANPRNLSALMGAGKAALKLGDAQAALTFFARAEEVSPSDGTIKMWIGSALVQLEQPHAAIKFFDEAVSLGVAQTDVARDRGLAWDISGDPRRAQRDYELALRAGPDPEATRRLALSLAISGEREKALQLLEEQLLVQDPAALRTRAFVLALTGDRAGADRATQAAMSGGQAEAMAPFLARLPSLSPAERAMAVNFGHFPGEGRPQVPESFAALVSATNAGRPDASQAALGGSTRPSSEPSSTAPRRRPGADEATPASSRSNPGALVRQPPVRIVTADARNSGGPAIQRQRESAVAPGPKRTTESQNASRLADVAALVNSLPDNEPPAQASALPVRTPSTRPQGATAPPAARTSAARVAAPVPKIKKPEPAKPAEPSRNWVQIAGGSDKHALPREFARLKAKAPKLLGSRSAWTTPLNVTNRLLVGPFASNREAQAFVNELGKLDMSAFAWTSPTGQKIEKLPAK